MVEQDMKETNRSEVNWRDHVDSASAVIDLPNGQMYMLMVSAHTDTWTAQAELLGADFGQLKFSGLYDGGDTRETAKSAALVALQAITQQETK